MPGSTSKGVPYPVGTDAAASLDTITQSLAQWVSDRPGVASLTTAEIAALTGADLWTGRVVFNNQTLKPLVYTGSGWAAISINTDVVQRDGSLAFTAAQSHPTAPSSGSHIANKTYVDGLNTENIKRDGSLAFTAAQSHPTAPSSGSHIANKTYVDGLTQRLAFRLRRVVGVSVADGASYDIAWDTEDEDTNGFANGTSTITITFAAAGIYNISVGTTTSSNGKGSFQFVPLTGTWVQLNGAFYEVSAGATAKFTFTNASGFGSTTITASSIGWRTGV